MKTKHGLWCLAVLCCASLASAAESGVQVDLRRAAPAEAHLVIYGKHNPERDYQRAYFEAVLQTLRDEKLVDRFVEIISSRMPQEQLDKTKEIIGEIHAALEPVHWQTLADCSEVLYVQQMEMPFNQHLVVLRYPSDGAERLEAGVKNLFKLVEKYSNGQVPVQTYSQGNVEFTTLGLPKGVPMRPVVARLGDVLVFSTSDSIAQQGVARLLGGTGPSKFDDPRLVEALAQLPEPEDAVVFFDASRLFSQLGGIGQFIRDQAKQNENGPQNEEAAQKVDRFASLFEFFMNEFAVVDYEVAVEYTEGNQNRTATLGKMSAGAKDKLLGTMLIGGEPFTDWQSWVPADAVSYSLSTGVRLHPFYERLTQLLQEKIPETKEGFDKWEAVQEQVGVHLDRDILQSFSGESVSVTLPVSDPAAQGGHESVHALKCSNPEKIRELLHRLVDSLNQFPAVQAQQLSFQPCEDLPEFERLNAMFFTMFGIQPVIGFQDGWMICGSSQGAVQRVLDARAGRSDTIDTSDSFQRFDEVIDGPINSVCYTNLAEGTHHAAQAIRQVGIVAPAIIGMFAAKADPEDLKPVQELLALLPSVANVVEKFDFLEAKLSIVQPGDAPDMYRKSSVILVRPPTEGATAD
jgi:hypothetical protein